MANLTEEEIAFQRHCTAIHETAHFVIYHKCGVRAWGIFLRATSSSGVIPPPADEKTAKRDYWELRRYRPPIGKDVQLQFVQANCFT
jgi:hypothetical protein